MNNHLDAASKLKPLTVVICGSLGEQAMERAFKEAGVEVLSALADTPEASDDERDESATHQQRRFDAITRADAIYVFNPGGEFGATAAIEIGWALSLGKPIYCKEVPQDAGLKALCGGNSVAAPAEIATQLAARREEPLGRLHARSSVADLQRVSEELAFQRGFQDEKPLEIMLMMVEEVGELAKALRKEIGLKMDAAKAGDIGKVELETADIFILSLHLANSLQFDLAAAFIRKEEINSKRNWKRKASLVPPKV